MAESSDGLPVLGHRALKKLENDKYSEYVIKMSLTASLTKEFKKSPESKIFTSCVQERVLDASKGFHRLGLAYNLIIKDCIESNTDIPDILDSTFARQIMLGLEGTSKPIPFIEDFLNKYNSILPDVPNRHSGDSNTYCRMAELYITSCKNYLTTTFEKFQLKFITNWTNINEFDDHNTVIKGLINQDKYTYRKYDPLPNNILEFIRTQRAFLGLEKGETIKSVKIFVQKNFNRILHYYNYMSKYLITHELKGFRTLPMNRIKTNFIHIDTDVFKYIFDFEDRNNKLNYDSMWDSVFDTNKHLTKKQKENNFHFTKTIQTDGVSICIHYRRPKIIIEELTNDDKLKQELTERKETDRLIFNDEGRVNMVYAVEEITPGVYKEYILTRKQYYQEAGMTDSNKKIAFWNTDIKDTLVSMSKCTTRTTDLSQFIEYVKTVKENYETLWSQYSQKKWAKLRLSLYSGKQKVFSSFFSKMLGPKTEANKNIKVKFICGDGGFASTTKHEVSCPTTRILKEARKYFNVYRVDEFRTTVRHYETGKQMRKVGYILNEALVAKENKRRNPKYQLDLKKMRNKTRAIRGLYCHDSDNGCKLINRDFNAAKNIGLLYRMYPERPEFLQRSKKKFSALPKLSMKIVNQR
jgi:hypothetical protein